MVKIQVVGSGCPNCQRLAALCRLVVNETGVEAEIEKVTELARFAGLGVMMTPGLLVDGVLMSSGRIPAKEDVSGWISEAAARVGS